MEFDFKKIEDKWRKDWEEKGIYKVTEDTSRPKYYVLDMFPYPSGAGLHVGHPLGYVASDIVARYKRLKGFNVLHPMGYDAFGLPAEQYAIETGTPPEVTTEKAIATYRSQLDKIGFSYDWSRQVKTSDPSFFKWTQWIFLQLFDSWYNREHNKAENIFTLFSFFAENGCDASWPQYDKNDHEPFTDVEWNNFSTEQQQRILMHYRLAYQSYSEVNWCEALGTVLANDEVKDGKSERGGYPVERRKMRQWFLRITEYADRLLSGLDTLDWSEAMKDMQRNWIGRSEGALITFLTPDPSPRERRANTILTPALSEGEGANSQFVSGEDYDAAKFMTGSKEVAKTNLIHAKENRKQPTEAEDKLWQEIRNEKLGFKFRRQHLIDKYIVDFVCLAKGLVVEVDGSVHDFTKEEDEIRTNRLNELGFTVIRFTNDEVLNTISNVLEKIKATAESLKERANIPVSQDGDDEAVSTPLLRRGAGGEDYSDKAAVSPLSFGEGSGVRIFTTRPDTIFGATFMVIAPEHELVESLTTAEQKQAVEEYIAYVKSRTDVERQQEKKVTGIFTGSYAVNPFTEKEIPIYLAEYVLSGYGTGAIMAVPANDERDRKFAEKFGLEIIDVIDQSMYPSTSIEDKVGKMKNSGMLDGMEVKDAIKEILDEIENLGIGQRKVNYRQRDAGYSRQRYWGEPFPIVYKGDLPYPLPITELPVTLPKVESYKPAGDGRSPIATATEWMNHPEGQRETDTMPGYAGSSWYFLRYMDPNNDTAFAAKDKLDYWQSVDLYLGGSEHAVGHLLYSRMWHKFLYDMGYVPTDEPFKKLVNQGMILGVSFFTYIDTENKLVYPNHMVGELLNLRQIRVPYANKFFEGYSDLQIEKKDEFLSAINCNGYKLVGIDLPTERYNDSAGFDFSYLVEKMSKSKYNVVNPDDVIEKYGADCFRMFEMFLGPLDQSKPWDDKGISGVSSFLRRFWRLYVNDNGTLKVTDTAVTSPLPPKECLWHRRGAGDEDVLAVTSPPLARGAGGEDILAVSPLSLGEGSGVRIIGEEPTAAEYKALHKTLKKISEDIERLQFNTCVSQFMICVNELNDLKCTKREILQPLLIALAPFAPFITEELWSLMGNSGSVHHASFPTIEEKYLVESAFDYPVSINGKTRATINLALDINEADAKAVVLKDETVQKWLNGAEPKKFIFVKGRIINVVI
jgi:leucyl-tRNA synthetase